MTKNQLLRAIEEKSKYGESAYKFFDMELSVQMEQTNYTKKQAEEIVVKRVINWINDDHNESDVITIEHLCNMRISYLYFSRLKIKIEEC